jgi:probable F420-dependent oxidoreductase
MDLGSVGVWSGELRFGDPGAAADMAAELEQLGYGALWYPAGNEGAFASAEALLSATQHVVVATGIISVWTHDAESTAAAHAELTAGHPGRFLLGLGISHGPLVDRDEPGKYRRPVATLTAYLDQLDAASPPVPVAERIIAALGPQMLELARQRSAGSHPYLVTPEHTKAARELLGPAALLAPEQAVLIETDPGRARMIGRHHLEIYLGLPNYVNNWRRLGFTDPDFANGGSSRLVDSLVAWGDAETVANRVGAHLDAGADHVCVQVLGGPDRVPPMPTWRQLAEVLIS